MALGDDASASRAVARLHHVVPGHAELDTDERADVRLVVDDQDRGQ